MPKLKVELLPDAGTFSIEELFDICGSELMTSALLPFDGFELSYGCVATNPLVHAANRVASALPASIAHTIYLSI